jgi:hypothetical protein
MSVNPTTCQHLSEIITQYIPWNPSRRFQVIFSISGAFPQIDQVHLVAMSSELGDLRLGKSSLHRFIFAQRLLIILVCEHLIQVSPVWLCDESLLHLKLWPPLPFASGWMTRDQYLLDVPQLLMLFQPRHLDLNLLLSHILTHPGLASDCLTVCCRLGVFLMPVADIDHGAYQELAWLLGVPARFAILNGEVSQVI